MVYDGIEFFNAAETEKDERGVLTLRRFPKSVIDSLNAPIFNDDGSVKEVFYGGRESARACEGIEIRLITSAPSVEITLESENDNDAMVFWGDFFHKRIRLVAGEVKSFVISAWEDGARIWQDKVSGRYPLDLLRVCFGYDSLVKVHKISVNGAFRLPTAEEMPKRMLVLGTSISHGYSSELFGHEYAQVLGRELGLDILNKGIAGGCFCEKEVREFVLKQDFDYGLFEIGTNIASRPEFFIEDRLGAMIDAVCESFKDKKLFFVTPFPALENIADAYYGWKDNFVRVNEVMKRHFSKYPFITVIDGHEACPDASFLATDILHPSPYGHFKIAQNIAEIIKKEL